MEQLQLFGDLFIESIVQGRKLLKQSTILEIRNIGELVMDAIIPVVPKGLLYLCISLVNFIFVLALTFVLAMIFFILWDATVPNQIKLQHQNVAPNGVVSDGGPSSSSGTVLSTLKSLSISLLDSVPKLSIIMSKFGITNEMPPSQALLGNVDAGIGDEMPQTMQASLGHVDAVIESNLNADNAPTPSAAGNDRNLDGLLQISEQELKQILDEFQKIDQIEVEEVSIPEELLLDIANDEVSISYNSRASTMAVKSIMIDNSMMGSDHELEDDKNGS